MKETYSTQFPIREDVRVSVNEVICRIAETNGYEVVEIKYFKEYKHPSLTIFVWKKGGIQIDDLEVLHNAVSDELDLYEADFPSEYQLNISSPGLDRPIVDDDDYRRNLGEVIEIFYEENGKKEKIHGELKAYTSDDVTIIGGKNKKEITINKTKINKVLPYIEF